MKVKTMTSNWFGIIGSRFVDVFNNLEDELENIIDSVRSRGGRILLSAAPGIDCRTLAFLLQNHADDIDFQVHMQQNSVDQFAEDCMALVDQELIDAEEAQYTIDQIKRLQAERPESLKLGQTNEEAQTCGRYASVVANCDEIFAIHASNNASPNVDKAVQYANENRKPVTVQVLTRTAA